MILSQFDFFRRALGTLKERTIAEIGSGDTIALAPLFLAAGAARYVVVDRFLGDIDGEDANRVYEELSRSTSLLTDWRSHVTVHRHGIEKAVSELEDVDVIVSFNVLEHLSDLRGAFQNMRKMLKHDGVMIHRIDYGPHDIWRSYENPLEFLTIPDWLWTHLGSNRGYPNRMRHSQVLKALEETGFETHAQITQIAPMSHVRNVVRRLCKRVEACSESDVGVLDADLVCRKIH